MKNIFEQKVVEEVIGRLNNLTPNTKGKWGKMNVAKMLAHCNVSYEMVYTDKHPKPNAFLKLILKLIVKNKVVGEKGYSQNGKTAPQFVIADEKDFSSEKSRLIEYIEKTQKLGAEHFDNKESHSFGNLTKEEWNNMFYKHLAHHLTQFGV